MLPALAFNIQDTGYMEEENKCQRWYLQLIILMEAMLHLYLFSTSIFMLTALRNLLTAWLPASRDLTAQDFLLLLILILYLSNARVYQYLHSFIPYTGKLWNSLPLSVFPPSYDLNIRHQVVRVWWRRRNKPRIIQCGVVSKSLSEETDETAGKPSR